MPRLAALALAGLALATAPRPVVAAEPVARDGGQGEQLASLTLQGVGGGTPAALGRRAVAGPGLPPAGGDAGGPTDEGGTATAPAAEAAGAADDDALALAAAMRAQAPRLRACYERALKGAPELAGRLVVGVVVQPDGSARGAAVAQDGIGHAGLAACVVEAVDSFRFAPRARAIEIEYPFSFRPAP